MNVTELIAGLQKKSYQTRIKILWTAVGLAGALLLVIWFVTLQKEIKDIGSDSLLVPNAKGVATEVQMITVERVELSETSLKIFFNITNATDDILNFSPMENIKLTADGSTLNPLRILDRQNKPFVLKILSQTKNFGALVFPPIDASSVALTFNDMYYEKKPETLLKETLELDLEELKFDQQLRK